MKKNVVFLVFVCFPVLYVFARSHRSADHAMVLGYIQQWKEKAKAEMVRTGIPASITLAQAIIETGAGNGRLSVLATKGNNLFGVKCHGWSGRTLLHDDDRKNECFRAYDSFEQSFLDHSNVLMKEIYKPLFSLSIYDYRGWAYGLKRAGYATDRYYARKLIACIETYKLYRYDRYTDAVLFPVRNV